MKAHWNGTVIAETDRGLEAGGWHYFPRESVRMDLLRLTPKTERDLQCPHGVQFFDVTDGTTTSERAAWTYEAPLERLQHVDHWIGFWHEVAVEP
jgi:uncharacterized protein (DUF427 family)